MPKLNWDGNDFRNPQDSSGTVADNISRNGSLQQGYKHGSLTEGLLAYYPMDSGSGSTLTDQALGNDGTLRPGSSGTTTTSGMWSTNSKIGEACLSFDGQDDHIELTTDVSDTVLDLGTNNDFTFSQWVYTHDNSESSAGSGNFNKRVWYIENSNGSRLQLVVNEGGKTYFNLGSSGAYTEPSTAFPENTWVYLTCVKRGSSFRIFKNGSDITNGSGSAGDPDSNTNLFWIGSAYDGSQINGQYNGKIDDVRIYERALSTPEIKALYELEKPSKVTAGDTLQ